MNADGTDVRRLTRTPQRYEDSPRWDPSGERLAYEQFQVFGEGIGNYAVMQVNADGTCRTKAVFAPRVFFLAPAWQPGPGREAGRIEC